MTTVIKQSKLKEDLCEVPMLNDIPDIPDEPLECLVSAANTVVGKPHDENGITSINQTPAKKLYRHNSQYSHKYGARTETGDCHISKW